MGKPEVLNSSSHTRLSIFPFRIRSISVKQVKILKENTELNKSKTQLSLPVCCVRKSFEVRCHFAWSLCACSPVCSVFSVRSQLLC